MQELKIALLGTTYVGKTSLLTSMYQEINKANRGINIQLVPDHYTQLTLGKRLADKMQLNCYNELNRNMPIYLTY